MKRLIWKFPLKLQHAQDVRMPEGAKILSCQKQGNEPCLWAEVKNTDTQETRTIIMAGTGNPLPEGDLAFIDTVQLGALVFHFFDKK